MIRYLVPFLLLVGLSFGQERILDKKFIALSATATASTLADSFTTAKIQGNRNSQWDTKHPYGYAGIPCSAEGGEPWLYGRIPSPARAYEIGVGKIVISETAAVLLRRSRFHRFWSVPLGLIGADSAIGAIHNRNC